MEAGLRVGRPEDAAGCGAICYEAFKQIAERHGFTPDIPSRDVAVGNFKRWLSQPGFRVLVAESGHEILGSVVLDERSSIIGLGPITVVPGAQDGAVGRRLVEAAIRRVAEGGHTGLRLLQSAYNMRSLSLYAKLGLDVREPLVNMQGPALGLEPQGCVVRAATGGDLGECDELCRRVHGHDRGNELAAAVEGGTARLVERDGRVTGYSTVLGFFGHAVGEANRDLQALIGAADAFAGPGLLVPTRNGELMRWCLEHGLRATQPLTLMSLGAYSEPAGVFLPSITY